MHTTLVLILHMRVVVLCRFPFLFWSGRVIAASLDLLDNLWHVQFDTETARSHCAIIIIISLRIVVIMVLLFL